MVAVLSPIVPPLIFPELQPIVSHFHINISLNITATNQYYLVLCLEMDSSVIYKAFRKYSPNWLCLGSLLSLKMGKEARTLNFGGASSLDLVGKLTYFQPLTHLNGTSQESPQKQEEPGGHLNPVCSYLYGPCFL